jgi:hypothetical protein
MVYSPPFSRLGAGRLIAHRQAVRIRQAGDIVGNVSRPNVLDPERAGHPNVVVRDEHESSIPLVLPHIDDVSAL